MSDLQYFRPYSYATSAQLGNIRTAVRGNEIKLGLYYFI